MSLTENERNTLARTLTDWLQVYKEAQAATAKIDIKTMELEELNRKRDNLLLQEHQFENKVNAIYESIEDTEENRAEYAAILSEFTSKAVTSQVMS